MKTRFLGASIAVIAAQFAVPALAETAADTATGTSTAVAADEAATDDGGEKPAHHHRAELFPMGRTSSEIRENIR